MQLSAFSKTWDCSTYVSIEDGKDLFMPGEDGTIVARLVKQQALEVGQTFTLRDGAHTVGTGKVRLVERQVSINTMIIFFWTFRCFFNAIAV